MNQQLVRYHVPAQMQVTAPQARVHEDLRFRGPGGIEAAGVSRGVKSEMSDPTAPEMSGTSMREEIPVAELNVLLKFLQTLGDLPKIDLGEPASRGRKACRLEDSSGGPVAYNAQGGDGMVAMVLRRGGDLLKPLA